MGRAPIFLRMMRRGARGELEVRAALGARVGRKAELISKPERACDE